MVKNAILSHFFSLFAFPYSLQFRLNVLMIRFEPWTSGVGINTCANWATTNAQAAPDYDILGSNPSKTLFIESQTKIDWFSIL